MDDERETRAIAALARDAAWADAAADLLADLGFSLINSHQPGVPGGSHLLVAIRATPTLRHFDPETVGFYATSPDGRVRFRTLDAVDIAAALAAAPAARSGPQVALPVLWGHVHVTDRLRVENRFLTFGGELRIVRPAEDELLLDLRSPGPIVRWGGHSQGIDSLAAEIGAFFGRLILAVDFEPGAEARIAATPPATLYAAFLLDADERFHRITRRTGRPPELAGWVAAEAHRIAGETPDAWRDAASITALAAHPAQSAVATPS